MVNFCFSIISELLDTTIREQNENARDEPVEAVFQSILREKNLNIKDKRAAIVDFIAAGIHTVFIFNSYYCFLYIFFLLNCNFFIFLMTLKL